MDSKEQIAYRFLLIELLSEPHQGGKCWSHYLLTTVTNQNSNRLQYPPLALDLSTLLHRQTLPVTAVYLTNDLRPTSVPAHCKKPEIELNDASLKVAG